VAAKAAGVEAPSLDECRRGYAALMIAAGVNVNALSTFMGHANIGITLDQYGHLLPGAEDEAAGRLDAFLARSLDGEPAPGAPQTAPHLAGTRC
jgi:integrase